VVVIIAGAGCGAGSNDGLPPAVTRALVAEAGDRSAALFRLVAACARSGMGEDAIYRPAGCYRPAVEKYRARLPGEVSRCLRRIEAS
jgi:hypothetical protein